MSGIYIPNMAYPKVCGECPFFVDEEFEWCGRCNYNICDGLVDREGKPDWCDLVPVPDHGRLIDADVAKKAGWTIRRIYAESPTTNVYEAREMDYLPTIIPSDGEDGAK